MTTTCETSGINHCIQCIPDCGTVNLNLFPQYGWQHILYSTVGSIFYMVPYASTALNENPLHPLELEWRRGWERLFALEEKRLQTGRVSRMLVWEWGYSVCAYIQKKFCGGGYLAFKETASRDLHVHNLKLGTELVLNFSGQFLQSYAFSKRIRNSSPKCIFLNILFLLVMWTQP